MLRMRILVSIFVPNRSTRSPAGSQAHLKPIETFKSVSHCVCISLSTVIRPFCPTTFLLIGRFQLFRVFLSVQLLQWLFIQIIEIVESILELSESLSHLSWFQTTGNAVFINGAAPFGITSLTTVTFPFYHYRSNAIDIVLLLRAASGGLNLRPGAYQPSIVYDQRLSLYWISAIIFGWVTAVQNRSRVVVDVTVFAQRLHLPEEWLPGWEVELVVVSLRFYQCTLLLREKNFAIKKEKETLLL